MLPETNKLHILINLFNYVRDFPYKVLPFKNIYDLLLYSAGDCRHKHFLLKTLLENYDIKSRLIFVLFDWKDLPLPKHILNILANDTIWCHTALEVYVDNKWLTIDATWDNKLHSANFPVNLNWNAKNNTKLVTEKPLKISHKKILVEHLTSQKNMDLFAKELNEYLTKIRRSAHS